MTCSLYKATNQINSSVRYNTFALFKVKLKLQLDLELNKLKMLIKAILKSQLCKLLTGCNP